MMWGMAGSDASQPMLCRRISAHHAVLPRLGVLLLRGGGDDGEIGYKVIDDGEDVVGSGRRNSGTWQKGRRKRALEASFVIKAVKSPGSQPRCKTCGRLARFGDPASGAVALYCVLHGNTSHLIVKGHSCSHPGCRKFPIFGNASLIKGEEGEGSRRCMAHKLLGDVDVFNPKCRFMGCSTNPSFAPPGATSPLFCALHRLPNHTSLRKQYHKLCRHPEGCTKHPLYGIKGSKLPLYCKLHKHSLHEDVVSLRCALGSCFIRNPERHIQLDEAICRHKTVGQGPCPKFASFGHPKSKPVFCVNHMATGMRHVKSDARFKVRRPRKIKACEQAPQHKARRAPRDASVDVVKFAASARPNNRAGNVVERAANLAAVDKS